MCHESTSVGLKESIGAPVGTVTLHDFATSIAISSSVRMSAPSPRMLHELQPAVQRGLPIITFNPARERGLEEFTNPQFPNEIAAETDKTAHAAIEKLHLSVQIATKLNRAHLVPCRDTYFLPCLSRIERDT